MTLNRREWHLVDTVEKQIGYVPFRPCRLMLHLDSAIYGVNMLYALRRSYGLFSYDGKRFRLMKRALDKCRADK